MRKVYTLCLVAALLASLAIVERSAATCKECQGNTCVPVNPGFLHCTDNEGSGPCSAWMGNCNTNPSCFIAGTQVLTPNGEVSLETLNVGDTVISVTSTGQLIPAKVTRSYRALASSYYVINESVAVTAEHPFLVKGRWVEAQYLRVGDPIQSAAGHETMIVVVRHVRKGVRTYNIEVAGPHTFVAEGLVVHNKGPDPEG